MSEKADYRANIERLNNRFPDKDLLNVSDVAKFTGFDRRKVNAVFGKEFKTYGKSKAMSKATLARLIS